MIARSLMVEALAARGRAWRGTLAPVLAIALLAGCASGPPPRWVEVDFDDISYAALYQVVSTTVSAEGFGLGASDPGAGRLETDWAYGTSMREVRGPSRRKVVAEFSALDEGWLVRMRVREEVLRKQGLLAHNIRDRDDWETWHDNLDDAEFLAAKLKALLDSHAPSEDFEERMRQLELRRDSEGGLAP